MQQINYSDIINENNYILIDVRTQNEFQLETIPGAINIPVLLDEERVDVGTAYKQVSKEKAKELGITFISKRLPEIFGQINDLSKRYKKLIFFCARGGMRSGSMASLFSSLGYKCYKLTGGFKEYRKFLSEDLLRVNQGIKYFVIHGKTGSGKTKILQRLYEKGYSVLDLEKYADHKGSFFGGLCEKRVQSQKRFEAEIYEYLRKKSDNYIFVESESKRIGNVYIPEVVHQAMHEGHHMLVSTSMKKRTEIIMEDYSEASKEEVLKCINLFTRYIGKEKIVYYKHLVEKGMYSQLAVEFMENYYDPLYEKSIKNRDFDISLFYEDFDDVENKILEFLHEKGYCKK